MVCAAEPRGNPASDSELRDLYARLDALTDRLVVLKEDVLPAIGLLPSEHRSSVLHLIADGKMAELIAVLATIE